ncbi:hypothetical protein [Aquimarina macrocephali]|uniref:hypothetical protein n=1 Tax=Aquimarina macrocephali TaxID=666563 RepID=UPI00046706EE|nr:hypothetical protein [Aquimarina macrocephali]
MFISPTQAVQSYNVSKPTLYADMKKGKLSFKKDDRGKRKIDVSELERLYEKVTNTSKQKPTLTNVKASKDETLPDSKEAADVEIIYLKTMLKEQKTQFESEVGTLRDSLRLAQEGHNKSTLILEHYTKEEKGTGWETAISDLKETISSKELIATEKLELVAKEKNDLAKASKVYAGMALISVVGAIIFALVQSGIIQIN